MANLVSTGMPSASGAVHIGPTTATLPTSVDATLTGFTNLGHVSEDGLTNANSRESEEIKDWGGATVLTVQTGVTDTYSLTLIDSMDPNVLKVVFGDDNVTGTLETGITIKSNSKELVAHAYVIDMIMSDGIPKRIVIPNGKISEVGEITYKGGEAIGYEITIAALPDESGNTHYEYMKKKTS